MSDWGHDRREVGVLLRAVATRTRAHVPLLGTPRFEPVDADGAIGSIGRDLVEMELDNQITKAGEHLRATLLRASEEILSWRGVINGNSAVILRALCQSRRRPAFY